MKNSFLPLIWLGSAILAAGADQPNGATPGSERVPNSASPSSPSAAERLDLKDIKPHQKAFLNLPEEQRSQYSKHIEEAARLFGDKRVFESLDELSKAEAIFKDDPGRLNLAGSCQMEFRAFDKALQAFERAHELDPDDPNISFNIGEIYFVTKQWKKCDELFEKLLKLTGDESKTLDFQILRLTEFKIMLCKIKLGDMKGAEDLAKKHDFLDDSPYYYFANASLSYEKKDEAQALEWLGMASRVFQNREILSPWQDTMTEFGFVTGGDSTAEVSPGAGK